MDQNIVQQVQHIESEADRIVAEAKDRAARLEGSLESEIAALRKEHEAALGERLSALKQKLDEQTASQLDETEDRAKKAIARLDSLDPEAVERALELVLRRLREDGACP